MDSSIRLAIAEAVRIANEAGLSGRRVDVKIIPPQTASDCDYVFAVEDISIGTGSQSN